MNFYPRIVRVLTLAPALFCMAFGAEPSTPPPSPQNSRTNAFLVYGKVTDSEGKPISGVGIRANCGIGTLLPTGQTQSDNEGNYRLAFGPGMLMGGLMNPGAMGVGFQAATIFASKEGYYTEDLGRAGDLAMTDQTNNPLAKSYKGIVHPSKPYQLDFVLRPAATIHGKLQTTAGKLPRNLRLAITGKTLPPSSSVLASCEPDSDGVFQFNNVPVGYDWSFEATSRDGTDWQTAKGKVFALKIAKDYKAALTLKAEVLETALDE